MKIYNYHPDYKYFLYSEEARQSPLDPPGTWLIPANATCIQPPSIKENQRAYWNGEEWEIRVIEQLKESINKYCPLLTIECIKEKCAWYVDNKCAIITLLHLVK